MKKNKAAAVEDDGSMSLSGHLRELRNRVAGQVDSICGRLFPQVEAYPELKAHQAIADAMQQNSYLQKEITAARTLYNDAVVTALLERYASLASRTRRTKAASPPPLRRASHPSPAHWPERRTTM